MRWLSVVGLLCIACAPDLAADSYELKPTGSRVWLGPDTFARPMQDWSVDDGVIVGQAARDRGVSLMSCFVNGNASFKLQATIELDGKAWEPAAVVAGFRVGTKDELYGNWKRRAVMPIEGVRAGVRADGRAFVGDQISDEAVPANGPIQLTVRFDHEARKLIARAEVGEEQVAVAEDALGKGFGGGVELLSQAPRPRPWRGDKPELSWRFSNVSASGAGLKVFDDRTFGPILWTQYTLSDHVLKLSVQMPPIGEGDPQNVTLEVDRGDGWKSLGDAPIDADARTAIFRIDSWDDAKDVPYRVVYTWGGERHEWAGTIRRDPRDKPFDLAALSCDNGYAFPAPALVEEASKRNPDLMFFAGDQIYESYGGFGTVRGPVDLATLDYLRKWYQFSWTWRELLRDRPSVIIPDDHDVFQGNIWGAGGRKLPDGKGLEWGGYTMPVRWVRMVERTQTGHLPDPTDPAPLDSGIGVYFTTLNYGNGSFAVLEDRKFKSGFKAVLSENGVDNPRAAELEKIDVPGATLLGDRQLAFLEKWGKDSKSAAFRVVLSQTMFAQVFTHGGPNLQRNNRDYDTNGWPQSPRNRALEVIANTNAIMVCGDQHFGALVRHGINRQGDGPLQFMVTGTVNGWPRSAWPGVDENDPETVDVDPIGQRTDAFGHPIDVLAVGNPVPRSNKGQFGSPQKRAREKGSGFGMIRFDPDQDKVSFDLLRYPEPKAQSADSFTGFPVEMSLKAASEPVVE